MEWIVTSAPTVAGARDLALDQLGVAAEDAEFEVLTEPSSSLFGLRKTPAQVRARVRPVAPPPKQERPQRGRDRRGGSKSRGDGDGSTKTGSSASSRSRTSGGGSATKGRDATGGQSRNRSNTSSRSSSDSNRDSVDGGATDAAPSRRRTRGVAGNAGQPVGRSPDPSSTRDKPVAGSGKVADTGADKTGLSDTGARKRKRTVSGAPGAPVSGNTPRNTGSTPTPTPASATSDQGTDVPSARRRTRKIQP